MVLVISGKIYPPKSHGIPVASRKYQFLWILGSFWLEVGDFGSFFWLTQPMANLFKLLGTTYSIEKISRLNVYFLVRNG